MIDLENRTITVQDKTEPITFWEVWFVTLEGTHDSWSNAVASAKRMNQEIKSIIPIPVALSDNLYEPCLNQGIYIETTLPATSTDVQFDEA